ncbi:MAG: hypothetical protein ACE5PO_03945 [Candidatus Bathyarchaeia archaeon]
MKESSVGLSPSFYASTWRIFLVSVKILVPLVALEFLLLRVFMRVSFLVNMDQSTAHFLVSLGEVAFNLAFIISGLTLVILALHLTRSSRAFKPLSFLILVLIGVELLLFVNSSSLLLLTYNGTFLTLVLTAVVLVGRRGVGSLSFLAVVGGVYTASTYYNWASLLTGFGIHLPWSSELFSIGELLALAALVPAFLALRVWWDRVAAPIATIGAFLLLLASQGPFLPLLATWAVNFTLHLHPLLYAVALWLFLYIVVVLLRRPGEEVKLSAFGLLLIAFGGLMLQLTYLTQIAVLGLLLLTLFFPSPSAESSKLLSVRTGWDAE